MNAAIFYLVTSVGLSFIGSFLDVGAQVIQLVPMAEAKTKKISSTSTAKRRYYTLKADWNNSPCNRCPDQSPPNMMSWLTGDLRDEPHYQKSQESGYTLRSGTLQVTEEIPLGTVVSQTYWMCTSKVESSCSIVMSQKYYDFCDTITSLNKPWTALVTAIDNFQDHCAISIWNFTATNERLTDSYFEQMLDDANVTSAYVRRKMEWFGNGKVLYCSGLSGEISISTTKSGSYKAVK